MKKLLLLLGILLAALLGYYLLRPLFVDDVVNEEFPQQTISPNDPDFVQIPDEEALNKMSDETKAALELSITKKMAELPKADAVQEEMPADESTATQLLRTGMFQDADAFHKGSGEANLYQLDDGSHILRLENFEVTNGPNLYVYLVRKQDPSKSDVLGDFVSLGRLKGNRGNQNYLLPSEIDPADYESVVIWCQAFSVLFSTANLT